MKILNKDIVKKAAELLLAVNGQTTTLDIKEHLRILGYWAEQATVSNFMVEVYEESLQSDKPLVYSWDLDHRVYKYQHEDVEAEDLSTQTAIADTQPLLIGNTTQNDTQTDSQSTTQKLPDVQPIMYDIKGMDNATIKITFDEDAMVAYSHESSLPFMVFDSKVSRDHARVMFARLTKTNYHDSRAMRLKNVLRTNPV